MNRASEALSLYDCGRRSPGADVTHASIWNLYTKASWLHLNLYGTGTSLRAGSATYWPRGAEVLRLDDLHACASNILIGAAFLAAVFSTPSPAAVCEAGAPKEILSRIAGSNVL